MAKPTTKKPDDTKEKKLKAWDIYSDDEKAAFKLEAQEISNMRDDLRTPLIEYDDKTFLQSYEENRKADLAYNVEIDEATDFRVTTGMTREKDTTLLSTVQNFNLEPNISAFQKDNSIIAGLGNEMEDLVKKSRDIENWKEKRDSIYRELIAQGEVYVEEFYSERRIPKGSDINWSPTMPIAQFKGDDMPIYDIEGKCEVKLHLGKYVMYSNMNEQELNNNDAVATYEEVDRSMAASIFEKWERWQYVPDYVTNETPFKENANQRAGSDYNAGNWNTYKVGKGKVGITKIYKRFKNRYQIYCNGVMMLPLNFPMTKISPSGLYPIAKGLGERIPNFSKGKGIPAKTRVDQRMYDTFLRAMIGKAWQSFRPALGNRSGNVLSRDIVNSNQITHGIKPNDIFTILPQQLLSVTNGDVSMFELIKGIISDKSVTETFAGQTTTTTATATEIVNQQKQTMLKLASIIDGVRGLEKRLILLRIYNLIANWTKHTESPYYEEIMQVVDGVQTITGKKIDPIKKVKRYQKQSVETTLPNGKKGIKVAQFHGQDEPLPSVREQIKMENDMADEYGKPVRLSFINADWLRNLQAIWNIEVIVSSDTDDQMQLLMFIDNLTRVAKLFGVQVFKQDYVLQRIALKMSEDFDKMFNVGDGGMAAMLQQIQGGGNAVQNKAQQVNNANTPSPFDVAQATA